MFELDRDVSEFMLTHVLQGVRWSERGPTPPRQWARETMTPGYRAPIALGVPSHEVTAPEHVQHGGPPAGWSRRGSGGCWTR